MVGTQIGQVGVTGRAGKYARSPTVVEAFKCGRRRRPQRREEHDKETNWQ